MNIRTYLAKGRPLLFDGGMGTYYAALPDHVNDRCEQGNLDYKEEILSIHRAYLNAGCMAIKTNTFSVGADVAAENDESARDIIIAGCALASEAARPFDAFVFADLGPAPQGSERLPAEIYKLQADVFLSQGISCFLVETLSTDEGIPEFARYLKERCPDAFLIVSYSVASDGMTREGRMGSKLFHNTAAIPEVDAVGFNCVSGPHHLLQFINTLSLGDTILSVMPNAGYPTVLGLRTVFSGQPDYFSERLTQFVEAGASIVGGCCGTTPAHIASAYAALVGLEVKKNSVRTGSAKIKPERIGDNPLWQKLESGKRVIAVELDPPVDDLVSTFLEGAKALKDAGADVVTIADCPVGRPRADSSLLACKIKREFGIEPLPHITCRDRNLNATKALLLGLSMEEVHNVLLVTGDPIPTENRDEVKSVFNFNSRKLAQYVKNLNETVLSAPFRIFGALNVNARNFSVQLKLAQEKEDQGMVGFLTQPVLSPEALENLKLAKSVLNGKILAGIFPVVSYRNACFLNNEISGIYVCPEIVSLYEGKSREEAEELAIKISARVASETAPYSDGIYLMTPFQRVALITKILEQIKTT